MPFVDIVTRKVKETLEIYWVLVKITVPMHDDRH